VTWTWVRYTDLTRDDLYDALALRCRVFILEQGAYLDVDGLDRVSWHLLGRDARGVLHAYLRVVEAGHKYAEPSIGRVITSPEMRGTGLGWALLAEAVAQCDQTFSGAANRISAQTHLAPFYAAHGFEVVGAEYVEDGIPHVEMLRPARGA
jgi:ElaA protein